MSLGSLAKYILLYYNGRKAFDLLERQIPVMKSDYFYFMDEAIAEAKKAAVCGDVPVGAVVVRYDQIIGRCTIRKNLIRILWDTGKSKPSPLPPRIWGNGGFRNVRFLSPWSLAPCALGPFCNLESNGLFLVPGM